MKPEQIDRRLMEIPVEQAAITAEITALLLDPDTPEENNPELVAKLQALDAERAALELEAQ